MDKPVDNPPPRYDLESLTRARDQIRAVRAYLETDLVWNSEHPTGESIEELAALDLVADFLTDTIETLHKQRENLRRRRRLEAKARRQRKRQNRKK